MAPFEIIEESDAASGWTFEFQVVAEDGTLTRHSLLLSWADYNLWSGSGSDQPAAVAVAVIGFLLSRDPGRHASPDLRRPPSPAGSTRTPTV